MAFSVPTLSDVSRQIENGFSSAFYGKSGTLRVGVLKVLSKVIAGGCYLPILFCQYIWRNSFIDSCDVDNLIRFGGWYNLPHKVAIPARGSVKIWMHSITTIHSGTILIDEDTGDEYETLESRSYTHTSLEGWEFKVVALNVGNQANRASGAKLKFRDLDFDNYEIEVIGINGGASYDVTVDGVVEQWGEDIESYRSRLKFRRQHQPNGGCADDYKQWCEKFSFVTDAHVIGNYPYTNYVSIFCADFNADDGQINDDNIAELNEYLQSDSRKPITSVVNATSVIGKTLYLQINVSNTGTNTKNDIINALRKNLRMFGFGNTLTTDYIKKILIENDIVSNCTIPMMKINGTDKTANGYTFQIKTVSGKQKGECVNINSINDSNILLGTD